MGIAAAAVVVVLIATNRIDPLLAIAIGVLVYLYYKQGILKKTADNLEYWKAREFEIKQETKDVKEEEKERRVLVREMRTERRRRVMSRSKEFRVVEKLLKPDDRATLKMLTPEQREGVYKMYGLKKEVVEAWIALPPAELERRKLGVDDDVD